MESDRDRVFRFIAPLLVIAAGLLAYRNALHGPFIFDDENSIIHNPHIRQVWPLSYSMKTPPQTAVAARPVAQLTLAINYALGDLHPAYWKAGNLAIHLISCLLLLGIVRRLIHNFPVALASALLFAVHPLTTEIVDYVTQRTESLMAMFALLTAYCFIRGWFVCAVIACALGMGCKEPMVVVPLLILAMDRIFFSKSWRSVRWPVHLALFCTLGVMAYLQSGSPHSEVFAHGSDLNGWNYLLTETGVLVYYLRLVFAPTHLVADYADWPLATSLGQVVFPALLMLLLLAATIFALVRYPRIGFVGLCFFLILGPSSSILPLMGEFAAERRMYLPLAAIIPLICSVGWKMISHMPRWVAALVLIGIMAPMILACNDRNYDYRSAVALWADTVENRPNNFRAWSNLAIALHVAGDDHAALVAAQRAVKIKPTDGGAHRTLGDIYSLLDEHQLALRELHEALALGDQYQVRRALALAYDRMGNLPAARYWIKRALEQSPDDPVLLMDQKRIDAEREK